MSCDRVAAEWEGFRRAPRRASRQWCHSSRGGIGYLIHALELEVQGLQSVGCRLAGGRLRVRVSMDVLASALLLIAFIAFVDLTFGEGNHVAAQLSGLFSSGATLGWPTGIQEEDHPWVVAQRSLRPTS